MTDAAPPAAVREQQDVPSWCNALGVDRRVVLFTKEAVDGALAAAAAASGGTG